MLPTKGYFQDIQCPFYNSSCGRPYCHFRHKRKLNETVEETEQEAAKDAVPTYKPTPKSELANIHNNKSHIPISYVPDLQFNRERVVRPLPRIEKPTYKPTPLSILSSANKSDVSSPENDEDRDTIKDIKQNIANTIYDPLKSEINFNDLSTDYNRDNGQANDILEPQEKVNTEIVKIETDIEEQQNKLNLLQSELSNTSVNNEDTKLLEKIKQEKDSERTSKTKQIESKTKDKDRKKGHDKKRETKDRDRDKNHSRDKGKIKNEHSKSDKEREKHRKEEKKNSSKDSKSKSKDKEVKKDKKTNSGSNSSSESDCSETSVDKTKSRHKKKLRHRSRSNSDIKEKQKSSREKSRSLSKSREHKSKHKSRDRSRSRSKHRSRKKSRSKEKHDKKKEKDQSDKKKDGRSHSDRKRKERSKKSVSESSSGNQNDVEMDDVSISQENIPSDVDLDLEDEDETMRECFKIFTEYKPEPVRLQEPDKLDQNVTEEEATQHYGKKRTAHAGAETATTQPKTNLLVPKPKALATPGQMLANRYKMAKLVQQNNEQENIMNEVKSMAQQQVMKRPATSLLEAARQLKMRKLEQLKNQPPSTNVVDDILNGVHKPSPSQVKIQPKRIAAVPNVALIEKAKERISLIKQRTNVSKTVAQTQKSGRVAHVPEFSLSDIPDVLQAEKSKLPVNVRTRFLTMLADECGKLYAMKEEAYTRALNEEFTCYEKCKVLATYRNSAMLAVNRLRKEIQERESKGLGLILSGENPSSDKEGDFKGKTFYNHVKKWLMTEEELDLHGYPRESSQKGRAVILKNKKEVSGSVDDNFRKCSRCSKSYQVDDDGWALFEEECLYHPLKKRTIRGEQIYLCCKSTDETGCATSETHVFDGLDKHLLEGYQTTMPPEQDDDPRSTTVYALDCEMCYTTKGLELTRVTIIDTECKTVYESLVKPLNPIIDYNTRFSGITKEQMDRTSTSILQIQANILHLCNSETILVGHSLESDLKALKIIHGTVIDTSVLFPHKMGLPQKRALRALASEYLKKIIQNDVSGHDSAEDAIACMELIRWKLKEDLKLRTK
ncbi:uncharacterized protein LOC143203634 isoform X1 [Rhynchophorus ferrugineus]|uniref:uncharacterized protein LOC143203634 isoform X1 n=1 Tax=Rhynchophorus ferrugineus TaxID=354439 RepID=UPI003FCCC9B7